MVIDNSKLVIEGEEFYVLSRLIIDSIQNDFYLLREVNFSDDSKIEIYHHINRCISLIGKIFDSISCRYDFNSLGMKPIK